MSPSADPRESEEPPIRFTDNRKLRRDTGSTAAAADGTTPSAAPADGVAVDPYAIDPYAIDQDTVDQDAVEQDAAEPDAIEQQGAPTVAASLLDERTADLQRLQAEYANYRKRADRDRLQAGDVAVARVLTELLPVIDDLERAKTHGDLTGPLKAVADKLEGVTTKFGLTAFGEVGDPFDPSRHEAVLHDESSDVTVPTCTTVMRPGYTAHDRLLRPAMVGVSDPAETGQVNGQSATTSDPTAEVDPAETPANPPNDEAEGNQPPVS